MSVGKGRHLRRRPVANIRHATMADHAHKPCQPATAPKDGYATRHRWPPCVLCFTALLVGAHRKPTCSSTSRDLEIGNTENKSGRKNPQTEFDRQSRTASLSKYLSVLLRRSAITGRHAIQDGVHLTRSASIEPGYIEHVPAPRPSRLNLKPSKSLFSLQVCQVVGGLRPVFFARQATPDSQDPHPCLA